MFHPEALLTHGLAKDSKCCKVFIFVVRQEWHTLQSLFRHLSIHLKLFSFASDTFRWIRLLGITALDSDTRWCHTLGCPLPLSWHLIMFGMASRLFMDVATSVMRQLLPFTWHRSDAVSTRDSVTAHISGRGSTAAVTWRTSLWQDGLSYFLVCVVQLHIHKSNCLQQLNYNYRSYYRTLDHFSYQC